MAFGIEDAGGYRSFYPRAYGEYWYLSQHDSGDIPAEFPRWCGFRAIGSPLLDALNVKYVLLPKAADLPEQRFRLVYRGESYVYENLAAFPRAFLVRDADVLPDATARLATLRTRSRKDLARRVILEKAAPLAAPVMGDAPPDEPSGGPRPVEVVRYRADDVELRVTDDRGGFVVVGDNYHPHWRAWVDGRPTEILRANHIMRAVPIGPGTHTIEMRFQAHAQRAGLLVSNLGWLLVLAVVVAATLRARRRHAPDGPGVARVPA
jgi:hypothetical protein